MNERSLPQPQSVSGSSAVLEIDLSAVAANWRVLRDRARPAECAAVVKADGYGLGLEAVAQALHDAGARTFFVAHLSEGAKLRRALSDITIYVLNGLPAGAASRFADARLRPVLGSLPEIEDWSGFCRAQGLPLPAAVHVDTGMNRLGLSIPQARALAGTPDPFAGFVPALLMSHLACADQPQHPLNARQLDFFHALLSAFPSVPASLANSAGTLSGRDFHFDLVRPGIALYGADALEGQANPMRPVATLKAPVIQVREVGPDETVGYGATYRMARPSRVAILGIGYADGYLRAASGSMTKVGAEVAFGDRRAKVIGRVSMDLTAVDVTDLAESSVCRGSMAEIFGPTIPVDEVARNAGTIGYELLTRLGARFTRRFVGR